MYRKESEEIIFAKMTRSDMDCLTRLDAHPNLTLRSVPHSSKPHSAPFHPRIRVHLQPPRRLRPTYEKTSIREHWVCISCPQLAPSVGAKNPRLHPSAPPVDVQVIWDDQVLGKERRRHGFSLANALEDVVYRVLGTSHLLRVHVDSVPGLKCGVGDRRPR